MIYIIAYEDFVLYETILINYLFKEKSKICFCRWYKNYKNFWKNKYYSWFKYT